MLARVCAADGTNPVLFNSYQFIFAFFPLTLAVYWLLSRYGVRAQHLALLGASWFFYAWWDVRFLPLLLLSITANYLCGLAIARCVRQGKQRTAGFLMAGGIALNLIAIGVFKYANFFVRNYDALLGADLMIAKIILPLGISFFTFEQITFLVDTRRGLTTPSDPIRYALFVSFFPRLVAGPILRYNEIVPQLSDERRFGSLGDNLMVGLTIFFIGLVKKAVFADGVAPYVSPVFAAAAAGEHMDFFTAWGGALAYTCQLYFDFSGYSDMAIGAARCFGIRFPMNFFSPYKATSIIDFWRRWHITLSRFLRDYLYFGLGGNRRGVARRYLNLIVTMLLGGLWHGANWTFVFWGGLHGLYLMINHAWIGMSARNQALAKFRTMRIGKAFGWALTFTAVVVAWVFFRSPTFGAALDILAGMAGRHGIVIPSGLAFAFAPVRGLLSAAGISFAGGSGADFIATYAWVIALLGIAFFAPNTQQLMISYEPVLEMSGGETPGILRESARPALGFKWMPSAGWAFVSGVVAFLGIISVTRVSEFLYWQF